MPWTDWQFWTVTVAALIAAWCVVRPFIPSKRPPASCPGCPSAEASKKPRETTLTIDGGPIRPLEQPKA